MTRYTDPDRLPSPDDYQQPADSPAAFTALADATQAALLAHDTKAVNAGNGLIGGGAIGTDPVLHVGAGAGIIVEPDAVRLDTAVTDGLYSRGDHIHPQTINDILDLTESIGTLNSENNAAHVALGQWIGRVETDAAAAYAPKSHGHLPSQVGIRTGQINLGSINAGDEKTSTEIGKAADEYVFIQSAHPSTYIMTSLVNIDGDSFQIKARNSTSGTDHTNVVVYFALIRGV
jgi:hypothetical protein